MEDDRRKLKLANHVIKEMKKIADTGPNKSHSKGINRCKSRRNNRYFSWTPADKSSAIF